MNLLQDKLQSLRALPLTEAPSSVHGHVCRIQGPIVYARAPHAALGQWAHISCRGNRPLLAEVVNFNENSVGLAPFDEPRGVQLEARVELINCEPQLHIPADPRGLVLNALGQPLNTPESKEAVWDIPLELPTPSPLSRPPIQCTLQTGIAGIDCLTPLGQGQRIGLFAGPGLGKSTLLAQLARNTKADVNVIALIGERGREVGEFIEHTLGAQGLRRSVLVVATSDESASRRVLAAKLATAIAEKYRNLGNNVLLLFDSLTRTARAIRDLSLAAGELPVRQGYTPSVYAALPRLIERTGTTAQGAITAVYTVLAQERQESDPLAEELKSLLDGHLVLSQRMVERGIRPAIDYIASISRLMGTLLNEKQQRARSTLIRALARLERDKDILLLGGSPDAELKRYLEQELAINRFLNCGMNTSQSLKHSEEELSKLCIALQ